MKYFLLDLIEKLNTAEGPAPSASNVRHRARTREYLIQFL